MHTGTVARSATDVDVAEMRIADAEADELTPSVSPFKVAPPLTGLRAVVSVACSATEKHIPKVEAARAGARPQTRWS